ncbi:MAG: hypothetical protein VKJ24_02235 [Synechococcales bacterium]|nr:hypothetical protein [Synechococcales bacterium]
MKRLSQFLSSRTSASTVQVAQLAKNAVKLVAKSAIQLRKPSLLASTLCVISLILLRSIVAVADGTQAKTEIKNTATASFKDDSGKVYDATSNTVTLTVAEVPGVTVTAQSITDPSPDAGETIYVEFLVTNVGNDPSKIFIPGTATFTGVTGPTPAIAGPLQVIAINGSAVAPINIPNTGYTSPSLEPNPGTGTIGTVLVKVPVQVNANANQGDTFQVVLGNTPQGNGQNQDQAGNAGPNDVYTVDNNDGEVPQEAAGNLNTQAQPQIREAQAVSGVVTVNAKLQAYASILKAVGNYSNNNTPALLTDDLLTYRLALKVNDPTPAPTGISTSNLFGTAIQVNSGTVSRVLVSDAIPAGTDLNNATPTAPTNWTVVYTTDPLTGVGAKTALEANWVTSRPASGITRVGFIFDAGTTGIPKGTTVPGFEFTVTPKAGFTGGQIANIAQVFGQSQPSPIDPLTGQPEAPKPGTPTQLVYDESGDQTANNGLNDKNPDPTTTNGTPAATGGISNGVADPVADGIDSGPGNNPETNSPTGTNQGVDGDPDGGETVIFTIAATPLNGPAGRPSAIGPTNNNDDFTNQSIQPPPGLAPTTQLTDAQTPPVEFTNTVQNTSGSTQTISLLPTPPITPGDLPVGTLVTITAGTDVAVYRYDGTTFVWQATGSSNTSATDPVELVNIPANDNAIGGLDEPNYKVTIDLPDLVDQLKGYPVPITAFIDQDNDGSFVDANKDGVPDNEPGNVTIDRLYTGFMSLVKEARVLNELGTPISVFSPTPAPDLLAKGRFIEYQITYRNISLAPGSGSNNVVLNAVDFKLTEDGTVNGNNWAKDQDTNGQIDTSHVPNTAASSGTAAGTITYFSGDPATTAATDTTTGTTAATDTTKYVNSVTNPIQPGQSGIFTFRRKVN